MPAMMGEILSQSLTDRDFARLTRLIESTAGIHLPPHKRSMVELRLARRARALGLSSLTEYCERVFEDASGEELGCMIDAVTTNKTDFFREADHFQSLVETVVPEVVERVRGVGTRRPLRVWSAGCATGEEPYSIAMVLAGYASAHAPFEWTVHGTDLCSTALAEAARAVYPEEHACAVPVELRRAFLLRSKDRSAQLVRVAPEIRRRVSFYRKNLLDPGSPSGERLDVVFCRNVIIYFERDTQVRVLGNLLDSLNEGGYLFVGHSETLHGMPLPIERIGPTLYRKVGA